MTEVVLYIACSLDGYIATSDGGVDWLATVEAEGEDYGYQAFFDSVDGLIMGSRTYEQILSFGAWPYGDKPCWVMSRRALKPRVSSIRVTHKPVPVLLDGLAAQGVARVWLVGGAALVAAFEEAGRIDEYIISIIPQRLGDGLPLFKAGIPPGMPALAASRSYPSGLVQLHYRRGTTMNG